MLCSHSNRGFSRYIRKTDIDGFPFSAFSVPNKNPCWLCMRWVTIQRWNIGKKKCLFNNWGPYELQNWLRYIVDSLNLNDIECIVALFSFITNLVLLSLWTCVVYLIMWSCIFEGSFACLFNKLPYFQGSFYYYCFSNVHLVNCRLHLNEVIIEGRAVCFHYIIVFCWVMRSNL